MNYDRQLTLKNWDQIQQYLFTCIIEQLVDEAEGLTMAQVKELALKRDIRSYDYLACPENYYEFDLYLLNLKSLYNLCPYVLKVNYTTDPDWQGSPFFDSHGADLIFNLDQLSKLSLEEKKDLAFAFYDLCPEGSLYPDNTQFEMPQHSPSLQHPTLFQEFNIDEEQQYDSQDRPPEEMLKKHPSLKRYNMYDLQNIKLLYKKLFYNQPVFYLWWD